MASVTTIPEGISLTGVIAAGDADPYSPLNSSMYFDQKSGAIALTVAEDPLAGELY